MRTIVLITLAAALALSACRTSDSKNNGKGDSANTSKPSTSKPNTAKKPRPLEEPTKKRPLEEPVPKRKGPREATPVVLNGVKFTAPVWGEGDKKLRRHIVEARNPTTNARLWKVVIYTVNYKTGLEQDVQDNFIKKLLVENGKIIIESEAGPFYELDPKTRAVTKLLER